MTAQNPPPNLMRSRLGKSLIPNKTVPINPIQTLVSDPPFLEIRFKPQQSL